MSLAKNLVYRNVDGKGKFEKLEEEVPKVGKGEVLVKVHACSLNFRDFLITKGMYPALNNTIPFSDGAGEVLEVGENVKQWKKGDRVYSTFFQGWQGGEAPENLHDVALGGTVDGMLAHYRVLDQNDVVRIPSHLSFEEASTFTCAAVTAYNCLFGGPKPIKAGQTVLILGTGGVSMFALQFAKAAGARVIITSSSDDKLEIAKGLGADDFVNYNKYPDWDKKVLELTNGKGVDLVVENGGAGTLPRSMKSIRLGGQVGIIGVIAQEESGKSGIALQAIMKGALIRGIYVGNREMYLDMNQLISLHKLKPVIDKNIKTYSFDEVLEAIDYLGKQKHVGKIIVKIA